MNVTYVVKKGTGTIERKQWIPTWNIGKIYKFRTKIMGWQAAQPNFTPQYTVTPKNILFGKRYGINGSHTVTIDWSKFEHLNDKFVFFVTVSLRNMTYLMHLADFKERDEIEFSIEDWDTHFVVRATNVITGEEKSVQLDKYGENTWWWTGGTLVEPKWMVQDKPINDFNILIMT